MNNFKKYLPAWVLIVILAYPVLSTIQSLYSDNNDHHISFSQLLSKIETNEIINLKIGDDKQIEGTLSNGRKFSTYGGNGFDLGLILKPAHERKIDIEILPPNYKSRIILNIFIAWFPMLLFIAIWFLFIRQMNTNGGKGGAFGFGKSRAKLMSDTAPKITFNDVAGVDEAKEEMYEMVEFLKEPIKFQKLGGKIPKGCLLVGNPGNGKTLLARAIAGEANVPFFSISGSDFVEMFVGVGASRVRDMFEQAKKSSPCIIFIDEIDAIGKSRSSSGFSGGNEEREQTLNQILVEMDGFDQNQGVIIMAATNRPDILDPALLRPGRFDRRIYVANPDINGREQILKLYLKKIKSDKEIDARLLARATPGFSGAELANLVNESALRAAKLNKSKVAFEDLNYAKDKLMIGIQKKTRAMTEDELKITAYHESGHALVALFCEHSDPIYKITIIQTNMALGMVVRVPENDRFTMSKAKIEDDIAIGMAGRVAEEIIFGAEHITTGASSDIKMVTKWARNMVEKWGMSSEIGTVEYGYEDVYRPYAGSDETRRAVDNEVAKIIHNGYKKATRILNENLHLLHKLANKLLQVETMTGDEAKEFLGLDQLSYKHVDNYQVDLESLKENEEAKNLEHANNSDIKNTDSIDISSEKNNKDVKIKSSLHDTKSSSDISSRKDNQNQEKSHDAPNKNNQDKVNKDKNKTKKDQSDVSNSSDSSEDK